MTLAPGQRWVSDTESDLGLGTIIEVDERMVSILFPASGETRRYAIKEAPITRVMFNTGDTVKSAEEWQLDIKSVAEKHGCIVYIGTRLDTGEEDVELRETMLDHFIKFNKPQDRLFAGQIDRFEWYNLRAQTLQQRHKQQQSDLRGIVGARASLIPHQLYIAEEVGKRFAPRVLLADEVGLGKTIEAGLIIHQQILSGRASRVLVVVPESLQHQWLVEMLRRFNLKFSIFDEERCRESHIDAPNPFETEQLVITSLRFMTKSKRWFEQATLADWDLLVVDEAHHLEWSENAPSSEYRRIEELAEDINGLILLTATPDQLGHESHFARLRLLDPVRFFDYNTFVEEESTYKEVADAANLLISEQQLTEQAVTSLSSLINDEHGQSQLNQLSSLSPNSDEASDLRSDLIQQLLDRHGTGRILFRNSRSGIEGFPVRQLNDYPMSLPDQYKTAQSVMRTLGSSQDPAKVAEQAMFPEQIYSEFDGGNTAWCEFDPRVTWLIEFLKENRQQKVLVICAHAKTALTLEQQLFDKEAIRAAVFHEGMSIFERDKAAAYFAQDEDSAQVLLCSEIGSEGRNFQFAHHLVLFDLPLNPDLLEQRIGRLDRIGQAETIQIHVPYFTNTAQQILFDWYKTGLEAFEVTCKTGHVLFEQFSETLFELMAANAVNQDAVAELVQNTAAKNSDLRAQLEQGRDKLLELNSKGRGNADKLVKQIDAIDQNPELAIFMLKVFDVFGISQEDKGDQAIILKPTEHMLNGAFPMLKDEGVSVTFDRNVALSQEDVQFLSWDHPMVDGAMEMIASDDVGNSSVALLKNKALPAGTWLLELMYVVEATAPTELQLSRFLPPTPIRMLMDKGGNNLSTKVTAESLNPQLSPVGRQTATKLVAALQSNIHSILPKGETFAGEQLDGIKSSAMNAMTDAMDAEHERLIALSKINPTIRQEEIDYIAQQKTQLAQYIDKAQVQLDAIRLIVAAQ